MILRFTEHKVDNTKHVFKPSKKGLFFSYIKGDVVLVNTLDSIKINTQKSTLKAQSIQDNIGQPTVLIKILLYTYKET